MNNNRYNIQSNVFMNKNVYTIYEIISKKLS